jgi:hypothetical protein
MRLWKHMAGLTGWAPPDALLQAVVEVATTAVCAGKLARDMVWIAEACLFGGGHSSSRIVYVLHSGDDIQPTCICWLLHATWHHAT